MATTHLPPTAQGQHDSASSDVPPPTSSSMVVVAQLSCVSPEARTELIQAFRPIIDWTAQKEPETLRYAVCDTEDGKDLTTIYVIEEYTSREAHATHMSSPAVLAILPLLTTQTSSNQIGLLSTPPRIFTMKWTTAVFEKPTLSPSVNPRPYIIWATIDMPSAADVDAITPYGAAVVTYARDNENGCLFYGDSREPSNDKFIGAVEVYKDQAAFGVHAKGEKLQTMIKECGTLGGKLTVVGLKIELGFLTRQGSNGGGDGEGADDD